MDNRSNVSVTKDDIDRMVVPFLSLEASGDVGVFNSNLQATTPSGIEIISLSDQLKIIQYLINKYSNKQFKPDTLLDNAIQRLDTYKVFTRPLDVVIKEISKKEQNALLTQEKITQVRGELLKRLQDFAQEKKKEIKLKPYPEAKGDDFIRLVPNGDKLKLVAQKAAFLARLKEYLSDKQHGRATLLNLFNELCRRDEKSQFNFIHKQRHPGWDRFRLFFKWNCNGPKEKNFWHTATHKKAIKMVKEAYLEEERAESDRRDEEKKLLRYVRSNGPVHLFRTESSVKFSR